MLWSDRTPSDVQEDFDGIAALLEDAMLEPHDFQTMASHLYVLAAELATAIIDQAMAIADGNRWRVCEHMCKGTWRDDTGAEVPRPVAPYNDPFAIPPEERKAYWDVAEHNPRCPRCESHSPWCPDDPSRRN